MSRINPYDTGIEVLSDAGLGFHVSRMWLSTPFVSSSLLTHQKRCCVDDSSFLGQCMHPRFRIHGETPMAVLTPSATNKASTSLPPFAESVTRRYDLLVVQFRLFYFFNNNRTPPPSILCYTLHVQHT
ncbi:hypothetical protein Hypma_004517 [Hypsizygus marmoreus]|uniref:Uncharacterized protein n=1 Tax=Hypsizygus marmoreus TaxID=39966 RepID=A0A369K635_HYPMA|nr:hypothetical protein Hypma_004517 [Hypsizygus marmoreus]